MELNNKPGLQSLNTYVRRALTSVQASQQWQGETVYATGNTRAMRLERCSMTDLVRPVLPFSQVMVSFELSKLRLSTLPAPAGTRGYGPSLESADLAHSPLLLSKHALPQVYDYPIQNGAVGLDTNTPKLTFLLLYSVEKGKVSFLELPPPVYTLVLALRMASDNQCALGATESLLDIAECWDIENVVEFVEQGLKVVSRLNDMGLLQSAVATPLGEYYE